MSETRRLADQFRRSVSGSACPGPSLLETLADVTAAEAAARPLPAAHSIAELVEHVTAWIVSARPRPRR